MVSEALETASHTSLASGCRIIPCRYLPNFLFPFGVHSNSLLDIFPCLLTIMSGILFTSVDIILPSLLCDTISGIFLDTPSGNDLVYSWSSDSVSKTFFGLIPPIWRPINSDGLYSLSLSVFR